MVYPVKFAPLSHKRIWGGSQLKEWFGETTEEKIGEYWVLSGHPSSTSVVINGELGGKSLVELTETYPEAYLGNSQQKRFPLLIKFLEASDDLSVQIHPDDAYAQEHEGDYGKTEAWYILGAEEGAKVNYGHSFQDREHYCESVREGKVKEHLNYLPVQEDQIIFVPAKSMHALMSGTTLIEIQQTSDVTYRVYDWDRVEADGKPRELHIEKAADAMRYGDDQLAMMPGTDDRRYMIVENNQVSVEHMVTCPYFTIEKMIVKQGSHTLQLGKAGNPDVLVVAEGEGELTGEGFEPISLKRGDTVLIPSTVHAYHVTSTSKIRLLRTYY
ncbi:class I mannose-6-phosphate isomerase [Paenibacillus sp. N1-5-1-14]|uniref:type I phosphomannose isomerase catalytic subunit n=1 Tax=Paenibacillus radicibacter TaxID=2972488 RepID=UPI0021593E0D|nr:type I phosphomannose isomerase catalytic subunit [Paenibacillus radicibacter]MCR8642515.1 class I mannose-6-phosphate isomerase [Paenibacillus radicibacter]